MSIQERLPDRNSSQTDKSDGVIGSNVYRKALIISLLALGLLSQACAGNAPAVSPSETPFTESETPSPTSRPSRTFRPTFTDTVAPEVAETAYYATLQAVETASIQTIVSTVEPAVLAEYPSPDGNWRVEVIRYECMNYSPEEVIAYEQLKLIDLSDGSEQVVADQRQNCGGLGGSGFEGLYWSPNNRYFYYSESREGFPDGMCGNYYMRSIDRLDTATGETVMVGGGHLSPDKTKLAMWDWPENEIIIWDLDRGEIGRVTALKPELAQGSIRWSLDSQAIIYVQTESECAPDYGTTYITRLDLNDYSQTLLVEYPVPGTAVPITPVPAGTYAILIYPPLVMNYDPTVWRDESQYADQRLMPVYFITNYLQALDLESCVIGPQGPLGNIQSTPEIAQLGPVQYLIVTFTSDVPEDSMNAYYIEDQSLPNFNYENGTAVLTVRAAPSEWDQCKALAEEVLATLHAP